MVTQEFRVYRQPISLHTPQDFAKINGLLLSYRNYRIRLWSYEASLSHLTLRIDRGTVGNFHLVLGGVESVILPSVHWRLSGQLEYQAADDALLYSFVDASAGVRINCGPIVLRENVDPMF